MNKQMSSRLEKAGVLLEKSKRFNDLSVVGNLFGAVLVVVSLLVDSRPVLNTGSIMIYLSLVMAIYSRRLIKKVDRILRDN